MNKLFYLEQNITVKDCYDSCVVVARCEEEARSIHPANRPSYEFMWLDDNWYRYDESSEKLIPRYMSAWVSPDQVHVEYIGETNLPAGRVIMASMYP